MRRRGHPQRCSCSMGWLPDGVDLHVVEDSHPVGAFRKHDVFLSVSIPLQAIAIALRNPRTSFFPYSMASLLTPAKRGLSLLAFTSAFIRALSHHLLHPQEGLAFARFDECLFFITHCFRKHLDICVSPHVTKTRRHGDMQL